MLFGRKNVVNNSDNESQEEVKPQAEIKPASKPMPQAPESKAIQQEKSFEKYKNIDWKRVSQDKVFAVMADTMLENKRLSQEIDRLNQEIERSYDRSNEQKDRSKENLESLAQRIAPSLINQINQGKKFSVVEMQEYIISNVLQDKKKYMEKVLELSEKVKSQKELLDELQTQYYNLLEKQNNTPVQASSETQNNEPPKPFTEADFKKLTIESLPEEAPKSPQKIIMKAYPLERARSLFMQEDSQTVCKIIGEEGISEFPALQQRVRKEGISANRLETVISNLEREGIVEIVKAVTFERNAGLRLVRLKDDIGGMLYKETFKKEPCKPEMQIIREENDNYNHGYSIKDTLNVLKTNYGYEDISMSRNSNTIKVANSTTWIPDIIAINPLTKKKEYFEVEMATSNDQSFAYKLDKALLVASELKIITDNKAHADKILSQVRNWYNSKKNKPNMTIKIFTYIEFKRKEEVGRFFPKALEEKPEIAEILAKKDKNVASSQENKDVKVENNTSSANKQDMEDDV